MQRLVSLARRVLLALALACTLVPSAPAGANGLVQAVDSITITGSDMDRALPFYEDVLTFEKVSDVDVAGEAYAPHGHVSVCACASSACGSATSTSNSCRCSPPKAGRSAGACE